MRVYPIGPSCARLVHHANIPAHPAPDWSIVRVYLHGLGEQVAARTPSARVDHHDAYHPEPLDGYAQRERHPAHERLRAPAVEERRLANPSEEEGIYSERGPITSKRRVYTRSEGQKRGGGEGIYSERGP
eukprot:160668-Pyramimonas_sp.AAC.2